MGNLSQKQRADIWQTYAESIAGMVEVSGGAIKILAQEGLYLALDVDVILVAGTVYKSEGYLWEQREALAEMFKKNGVFDKISKNFELGNLGINITLPNPLRPIFQLIKPLGNELENKEYDKDRKEYYYVGLDPIQRILLALVFTGMIRLLMDILAKRSTLTLG